MDLFRDIVPSILHTKKNVIQSIDDEKSYVPFVVNKTLSYHLDCILQANEMNMNHQIPKKAQYQYLINNIRSWKRPFQKWMKYEKPADIDVIKEYYGYSDDKSREVLKIISPDQLNILKQKLNKGGLDNDKSGRTRVGNTK